MFPLVFPILLHLHYVVGANILLAYDLPSPSHQIWDYAFVEGLVQKGHNVTMLGPFTDKSKPMEGYHPLVTEGLLKEMAKHPELSFVAGEWNNNFYGSMVSLGTYSWVTCNHTYHTKGFQTLMNYPRDFKFDLIIVDLTVSPCFAPFIQRFGYPPTIGITALLLPNFLGDLFGNPLEPAYVPYMFGVFTEEMDFFQRVRNFVYTYIDLLYTRNKYKEMEALARPAFGDDMDSMDMLLRHISLLLCNLNPAITVPQPLTPNIIPVGGLHIKEVQPLPKDLKAIMDKATNGVILFCLGTNVMNEHLSPKTIRALIDAFAKLKYTVLWKSEVVLDNLPKNVINLKWVPQNDILGHPNTKLFIGHGGALSTFEAIYHGVPTIGMPFIVDQRTTVNSMVEKKIMLKLDFKTLTSQDVLDTINESLNNPMYSQNIKELSRRMKDQPETPLQRAVFWAEFAIRNNGGHFLSPKSRDISFFVSSSMDVILFLIVFFTSSMYMLIAVIKRIVGCPCKHTRCPAKKEKQN